MCDLRGPPKRIKDRQSGEIKDITYKGNIDWPDQAAKFDEGMYYIACTGSHYRYYDGAKWHCDWFEDSKYDFLDQDPFLHSEFCSVFLGSGGLHG